MPTYHDLYITTSLTRRTSIFDLPFSVKVICTRTGGWEVWNGNELIGGEYEPSKPMRLDVNGTVIMDSML